ncbi:TPA: hypothetical protein DEO28_00720 [Candidatus Dependentiae bacterium]|nr:MAG: hypothetical protein UR14_C0001G0006 [candidate division TM6 bacterium GW2011_GWE2_31_21]KKP54114.1 MAG: hypothetical protein UR43_C0001G0132 [candidate division TM6 bacterium GW2011_GWF2_33_332]HBS48304.1 hypothetical protein [Candidatus Dependentiae bacterium]HBZ73022.1 hypothetical protein [Candidatus Dependentiae bacterium]
MAILKHIQILVFVLFPACLLGMEQGSFTTQDRLRNKITFEWYKTTSYEQVLNLEKPLMPVWAEAFADLTRDFLLDRTTLQIKKEYVEIIESLPKEAKEWRINAIEFIKKHPSDTDADRKARVEYYTQDAYEYLQNEISELQQHSEKFLDSIFFVVIVKNENQEPLGYAFLKTRPIDVPNTVYFDTMVFVPGAQNRGFAKILVRLFLEKLKPETRGFVFKVLAWNLPAQTVYRNHGCTECGRDGSVFLFEVGRETLEKMLQ